MTAEAAGRGPWARLAAAAVQQRAASRAAALPFQEAARSEALAARLSAAPQPAAEPPEAESPMAESPTAERQAAAVAVPSARPASAAAEPPPAWSRRAAWRSAGRAETEPRSCGFARREALRVLECVRADAPAGPGRRSAERMGSQRTAARPGSRRSVLRPRRRRRVDARPVRCARLHEISGNATCVPEPSIRQDA